MLDGIRDTDYVGRLSGDKFALLLTRTSWENGIGRAECVERKLNNFMVDWRDRKIAVSASLGLQKYGAKDEGVDLTAGPMKPCIKLSAYVLILLAMHGALSRHSGALSERHNERGHGKQGDTFPSSHLPYCEDLVPPVRITGEATLCL